MTGLTPTANGNASPASELQSRKRLRSQSASSTTSGASSPKRAASDSPDAPKSSMTSLTEPADQEIDEYMQSQGESLTLKDELQLQEPADEVVTPKDKLDAIRAMKSQPLELGETWYVVDWTWYAGWESACGGRSFKGAPEHEELVGAVDNSPLATAQIGRMKRDLLEGEDYELVPEAAWALFVEWYGLPSHAFPRKVISEGMNGDLRIEFYPIHLLVYRAMRFHNSTANQPTAHVLSRTTSLRDMVSSIITPKLQSWGHPNASWRIWKVDAEAVQLVTSNTVYTPIRLMATNPTPTLLPISSGGGDMHITLEDAMVRDDDRLVIDLNIGNGWVVDDNALAEAGLAEKKESPLFADGDFFKEMEEAEKPSTGMQTRSATRMIGPMLPPGTGSGTGGGYGSGYGTGGSYGSSYASGSGGYGGYGYSMARNQGPPRPRGTIGLINLGNTCFMNSALQCLAHLPEMTDYFINNLFIKELNPDNPLSTGGDLARAYGLLLSNLFDATTTQHALAPRELKLKISKYAPSFSGYAQHDTQELLAFLLDGLHEDLNRIVKKPYVENPDWNGGGDEDLIKLAREYWSGYKKRNDSVIVDLFQGQYKSTLVCPECQKVSITFDPFMYLTLPLPYNKAWEHDLYFVTWDTAKPNYKTHVSLPRTATVRELRILVAKWFDSDPEKILVTEIFSNRIYKFFQDYNAVSEIADNDVLFVYELPIVVARAKDVKAPSNPDDPVVLPVYTVSPSAFRSSYNFTTFRYAKQKDVWGYPFFIAVPKEDAGDEAKIYDILVERYSHFTHMARDLYTWQEESPENIPDEIEAAPVDPAPVVTGEESDGSDGVMVTAPASETESINGDPFVEAKVVNDDEDDDELDEVTIEPVKEDPDTDVTAAAAADPVVVRGPPKPEIFTIGIMEDNFDVSPTNQHGASYDSGKSVDLERRRADKDGGNPTNNQIGWFKPKDGIVCEWDSHMQTYFFGNRGGGREARWNETESYVDAEQELASAAKNAKQKKGISIEDCLDEFVKEEQLGEADPWYCPRCKKHQQATKKFDIWKVPDILVVHLKRFSNSRMLRDKIDVLVDFPIEGLDLDGRVEEKVVAKRLVEQGIPLEQLGVGSLDEPLRYDLFAVDEHMGGLGGGHYRAYAINQIDKKWYHFDDSRVDEASPTASVTPYAYLLFYRRRTTDPIGGTTAKKLEAAKLVPPSPPPEVPIATSSTSIAPHRALPSTPPKNFVHVVSNPVYDPATLRSASDYGGSPKTSRAQWMIDDSYNDWDDLLTPDLHEPENSIHLVDMHPDSNDLSFSPPTSSVNVSEGDDEEETMRREEVLAGHGDFIDEDYDTQDDVKEIHPDDVVEEAEAPENAARATPAHPPSPASGA